MRGKALLLLCFALVLLSGLSYAGWRYVHAREQNCAACLRPVHLNTATKALVNGKPKEYCCPACAMSDRKQTGLDVKVLSLTEYTTGAVLHPETAFIVRGSDRNSCTHHEAPRGMDKQPVQAHFDRCSPSLLAFSTRDRAAAFAREHGGKVMPFADVDALFR